MAMLYFAVDENLIAQQREAIFSGEWWRIVTGGVAHSNVIHLLLNCTGLAAVWLLHAEHYRPLQILTLSVLQVGLVGAGILLFYPNMQHYVGLSGALHGLFIVGAILDIRNQERTGWLILLGVTSKVVYENIFGASNELAELIAARVAVEAHLLGLVAGLLVSPIWLWWTGGLTPQLTTAPESEETSALDPKH